MFSNSDYEHVRWKSFTNLCFPVADNVIVTSKSATDNIQHIWESDASSFSVVEDPRGNSLKRGTQVRYVSPILIIENGSNSLKKDDNWTVNYRCNF